MTTTVFDSANFAQAIAVTPALIEVGLDWLHLHGDFDLSLFFSEGKIKTGPKENLDGFRDVDKKLKINAKRNGCLSKLLQQGKTGYTLMKPNFDLIINRRDTDSIKWNYYDENVLPLWVADMDFLSPPEVTKAIIERVDHGLFGYSKTQKNTKRAVQGWLSKRHGWDVEADAILLIPGVIQSFNVAASAFSNPGDSVLLQTPSYHPFFEIANNSKLIQVINPLVRGTDGKYSPDIPGLKRSIRPNTRTFMLCNPHNPTGRVFTENELRSMAEICLDNNTIICSDEIHSDLIHKTHKHIPIASLSPEIANSTITLISTTKTFNLAGLKSSAVIITNPRLRETFQKRLSGFVGSVNLLGETALAAAYTLGENWLSELLQYLDGNRQFLIDYVENELPGLTIYPPEGTYLGWLNCSGTGLDNPAEFFLEKARVGLNSGAWFGEEYADHVRINFGCPKVTLSSALDRIREALNNR